MAAHNMDLLLFRVALVGSLLVGLMILLPSMMSVKHQTSQQSSSASDVDVSCWAPAQFTSAQVRFTDMSCLDNFRAFLRNESDRRVYSVSADDLYPDASDDVDPRMERVKELWAERNSQRRNSGERSVMGGVLSSHTSILAQLALSVIVYAVATWVRSTAGSSLIGSCIRAMQANAMKGGSTEKAGNADKESLLPTEDIATSRVKSLYASRTLAITYLLLHLVAVLAWFILFGVNHHGASQMVNQVSALPEAEATTNSTADLQGGMFLCDFQIRKLGNIERFTVQCAYEVNLSNAEHSSVAGQQKEVQKMTAYITQSNAALCFTLGVLGVLYMFNFFWCSATSRWHSISPILQQVGVKSSGASSFGTTDLSLACAFSE